jgi:hypothetical protein
MTQTKPKTFRQYLKQHEGTRTPIGYLATDALSDSRWKGQRTAESLYRVMYEDGACDDAFRAFFSACETYAGVDAVKPLKDDFYGSDD